MLLRRTHFDDLSEYPRKPITMDSTTSTMIQPTLIKPANFRDSRPAPIDTSLEELVVPMPPAAPRNHTDPTTFFPSPRSVMERQGSSGLF